MRQAQSVIAAADRPERTTEHPTRLLRHDQQMAPPRTPRRMIPAHGWATRRSPAERLRYLTSRAEQWSEPDSWKTGTLLQGGHTSPMGSGRAEISAIDRHHPGACSILVAP
jgi:hypothetical protein